MPVISYNLPLGMVKYIVLIDFSNFHNNLLGVLSNYFIIYKEKEDQQL